jgi:ornithine cyclodeaminase
LLRVVEADVRNLLPFPKAIELAREAYSRLATGQAINPKRLWLTVPGGASMFFMPAHVLGQKTVSIKIARLNPDNATMSLPTVMSDIQVYDASSGIKLAEIEAESLTAIRTAASSAVATDALARRDAECVGLFGTGRQAEAHVPAIQQVRDISRVIVYSRHKGRREAFAKQISRDCEVDTVPSNSPEEVVKESDLLLTATTSQTPVFNGELVKSGSYVNAIGAAEPHTREIDTLLVKEKAIDDTHIRAELGELLTKKQSISRGSNDITLFKSGGLAVLDAIAADYILSQTQREDL